MDLRTAAYSVQLLLVSLALERLGHLPCPYTSLLLPCYCPLLTAQLARRRQAGYEPWILDHYARAEREI